MTFAGLHPEAVGLQATRTMQLTVSQCVFRDLLHGIHFTERDRNAILGECHIYNNRGAGVFVDRVDFHQLNIGNSHISYNHGGGIVISGGALRNLQVAGCDIEPSVVHRTGVMELLANGTSRRVELEHPDLVVERGALRRLLAREVEGAGVEVRLGGRVQEVAIGSRGMAVRVRNGASARLTTRHLIGADGSRSVVAVPRSTTPSMM